MIILSTLEMNPIETLRHSYLPTVCKVVLIGESAPDGGNFFYKGDTLCTYTKEAFCIAFPDANIPNDNMMFLNFFRDHGFYLDDLSLITINNAGPQTRQQHNREGVPALANRLKDYKPEVVICIMLAISDYVIYSRKILYISSRISIFHRNRRAEYRKISPSKCSKNCSNNRSTILLTIKSWEVI